MLRFFCVGAILVGGALSVFGCGSEAADSPPDAGDGSGADAAVDLPDAASSPDAAGSPDAGPEGPPGEIGELVAVQSAPGVGELEISWEAASGASEYFVAVAPGAVAPATCTTADQSSTATSVTLTAIDTGQFVAVRVCAANGNPVPDLSAGLTTFVFMNSPAAPEPTNLQVTGIGTDEATVTWASGGGSTTGFRFAVQQGAAPTTCGDMGTTGTTRFLNSLDDNTTYGVRVCAVNGDAVPLVSTGATTSFTTLLAPIPEVSGLTCSNLASDPRVHWTGGTSQYFFLVRLEGFEATACDDAGTQLIDGVVGANSKIGIGGANETYIVWICGVDGSHPDNHTAGKRIRVTMPNTLGGAVLPGSCAPLPD